MPRRYYTLPLRPDLILEKKQHEECSQEDSIRQNLHLIISTYQGESAYSNDFGCSIWNEEFNIQTNLRWKEDLLDSLATAISKFERRLVVKKDNIAVFLEEQIEGAGKENPRLRRALHIEIKAVLKRTNEPFLFRKILFISPVAEK